MLFKGQKTNVYAWLPPMSFLIRGELFNQCFLALCFFSVKKDAVFSLGIRYGCELSEWARDSGALKGCCVEPGTIICVGWTGEQGRRQGEKVPSVPCMAWTQALRADPRIF